eukprot:4065353-Heterocapsa_arctica.AAC.1
MCASSAGGHRCPSATAARSSSWIHQRSTCSRDRPPPSWDTATDDARDSRILEHQCLAIGVRL